MAAGGFDLKRVNVMWNGFRMRSLNGTLGNRFRRYSRDEDGSMVVFTLFILAMMLMVGGMAVDMMRFENYRARLQATLDRAVLAAADLDICLDPSTSPADVVNDYVTKAGFDSQVDAVVVNSGSGSCTVTVQASIDVNTIFMQAVGVDQLSTPTVAVATERSPNIEISLVLDTSGSMGREGRIEALRPAAAFVDAIFAGSQPGTVSMSMVPYSSNVNIGPDLIAQFDRDWAHDYSYCLEMENQFWSGFGLDPDRTFEQTAHADPYTYSYGFPLIEADRFLCDTRAENIVIPWADSAADLTGAIANLQPHENTSIDFGAKWGTALLSPEFRSVADNLIANGTVDAVLSGRPSEMSDVDTRKVLVLMTDGMNTYYHDFNPTFPRGLSDIYYDAATDTYYLEEREIADWDGDGTNNEEFFVADAMTYIDSIDFDGDGAPDFPQLTWNEVFDTMSFDDHAWFFRGKQQNNTAYQNWSTDMFVWGTTADKNGNLDSTCTQAKNEGVIIYTIAMMAPDSSIPIMQNCASSPSHFYNVEDLDVAAAFENIAQSLTELQLVQ